MGGEGRVVIRDGILYRRHRIHPLLPVAIDLLSATLEGGVPPCASPFRRAIALPSCRTRRPIPASLWQPRPVPSPRPRFCFLTSQSAISSARARRTRNAGNGPSPTGNGMRDGGVVAHRLGRRFQHESHPIETGYIRLERFPFTIREGDRDWLEFGNTLAAGWPSIA